MNNSYLIIVVLIVVIVCLILFTQREKFKIISKKDLKIVEDYEPMEHDEPNDPVMDNNDSYEGYDFGPILLNDIIEHAAPYSQIPDSFLTDVDRRYRALENSYFLPDNIDYNYHPIALPQVILKGKNSDYSLSTFIRGDIPIVEIPNIPIVGKSRFGRDSQNLTGLFANNHIPGYSVQRHAGQYGSEVWVNH